jgi:BirA family biotin operon repressor/biotin-[acetyl-CoA-carboxylase] ligase
MNEKALNNALSDLPIPTIHYFDETDSTNERALAFAAQGAPEFTLVIAERQTAGRGRFGRNWETSPGASLAFSIILHPSSKEQDQIWRFSFLGALAICQAIEKIPGETKPRIKWPNDVLLDGQKTAGILAETSWQGNNLDGLVLGIGLNLLPGSVPPAERVMFPATCIQSHFEYSIDRLKFLASVINYLIFWRSRILTEEFHKEYQTRLAFIGQQVILTPTEGISTSGKFIGIDQLGKIILKMEDGNTIAYSIGDLRLRLLS